MCVMPTYISYNFFTIIILLISYVDYYFFSPFSFYYIIILYSAHPRARASVA